MEKITQCKNRRLGIELKKLRMRFLKNNQHHELKQIDTIRNIFDNLEAHQYPTRHISSYYGMAEIDTATIKNPHCDLCGCEIISAPKCCGSCFEVIKN